jgi:hypothetical protein
MGAKQSEFQLVEVENINTLTGTVSGDGREYDFILEHPYCAQFSTYQNWMLVYLLTDADFICMDIPDNSRNSVYANVDRNVFVPAIGKYVLSLTGGYPSASLQNNANNDVYPRYDIYDSLGRRWIKIEINGKEYNSDYHKWLYSKQSDLPVYYCTEADLGKVFPQRIWDKHYTFYPSAKLVQYRDISVPNEYFDGLMYVNNRTTFISDLQNNAPASYEGIVEGYLVEIPDYADQIKFNFQGSSAWVSIFDNTLKRISSSGWAKDSYTVTNTSEMKYVVPILDGIYDIDISIILISEW